MLFLLYFGEINWSFLKKHVISQEVKMLTQRKMFALARLNKHLNYLNDNVNKGVIWQFSMKQYKCMHLCQHKMSALFRIDRSRFYWLNKKVKDWPFVEGSRENSWAKAFREFEINKIVKQAFERCIICQRMLIDSPILLMLDNFWAMAPKVGTITSP